MTDHTNFDFGKDTEARDVAKAFATSIRDRVVLITGVNEAGIGFSAAQAFASQKPRCLILAGRSQKKLQLCHDNIRHEFSDVKIRILLVDLSSQSSIKLAAAEVLGWTDVSMINLVINNAGIMRHGEIFDGPVPTTEDGIEEQFGTNHIGHFLLTNLIMPKVIAAAATERNSSVRIINVSSSGAWLSPFRSSDLEWQRPASELRQQERPNFRIMKMAGMEGDDSRAYVPTVAYGHSKTCNILFSVGLNQRLFAKHSILSLALNPGEIKTELSRNTDSEWLDRMIKQREDMGLMEWKSLEQGASTTLVAACDPSLTLPGPSGNGQFLADCRVAHAPPHAINEEAARELWRMSESLTGQSFSF